MVMSGVPCEKRTRERHGRSDERAKCGVTSLIQHKLNEANIVEGVADDIRCVRADRRGEQAELAISGASAPECGDTGHHGSRLHVAGASGYTCVQEEVSMTNTIRVNLANPQELVELLGVTEADVDTIIRFRRDHGPIADEQQFGAILGGRPMPAAILDRLDFSPSEPTAPEAPGA